MWSRQCKLCEYKVDGMRRQIDTTMLGHVREQHPELYAEIVAEDCRIKQLGFDLKQWYLTFDRSR